MVWENNEDYFQTFFFSFFIFYLTLVISEAASDVDSILGIIGFDSELEIIYAQSLRIIIFVYFKLLRQLVNINKDKIYNLF